MIWKEICFFSTILILIGSNIKAVLMILVTSSAPRTRWCSRVRRHQHLYCVYCVKDVHCNTWVLESIVPTCLEINHGHPCPQEVLTLWADSETSSPPSLLTVPVSLQNKRLHGQQPRINDARVRMLFGSDYSSVSKQWREATEPLAVHL